MSPALLAAVFVCLPLAAHAEEAPATPAAAPAVMPAAPAPAPPLSDVEKRLKELEETIRKQQDVIQQLQQTVETLKKTGPDPAAVQSIVDERLKKQKPVAGPQEGFTLQSSNGDFKLRLRGLLQFDTRTFPFGSGRTGNESFLMRRVRPVISGTVGKYAEFMIQPAFDEGRPSLFDAFVDVREGQQLQLRFGKYKTPFSLERLQAAQDLSFVERSLAQNLAPNRDVGVQLHGDTLKGRLSYAAGVMNGAPDGVNIDGDAGREKDIVARVFLRPWVNQPKHGLRGLGFGVAATHGERDEALPIVFRAADRNAFFQYRTGTVGAGALTRVAPQFYYYHGPLGLMGEYYHNSEQVARNGVEADLDHHGWFLQATYVVTGEHAGFRSPTPRHPFDPNRGYWGAFEVGARYSRLDLDDDSIRLGFADRANSALRSQAWTLGLNWYLTASLKFQLNYEHTSFGRAIMFGPGARDHQDVFLTRFQLAY